MPSGAGPDWEKMGGEAGETMHTTRHSQSQARHGRRRATLVLKRLHRGSQDTSCSLLTSTGDVVLDAKVSIWAPWVVAGCEDDATHCLDFADHAGHGWSGHDAILTNHQMVDLQKGEKDPNLRVRV